MAEIQGAFWGECTHPHKIVVPEKRGPHVAKLICRDCKKFFSWVPKPESVQQQKENTEILTALSKLKLPPWEHQFVKDVITHKKLSPRQQEKLLELKDVFLSKKDGVWGIKQEYFDKVYPSQRKENKFDDGIHGEKVSPD